MCGSSDHVEADCPSVASACSGEDARLADKATDYQRVDCLEDLLPEPEVNSPPVAAVSPRSSDGPAWLSEYETLLENMYAETVEQYKTVRDPTLASFAQGLMRARVEFDRLRTQGHS